MGVLSTDDIANDVGDMTSVEDKIMIKSSNDHWYSNTGGLIFLRGGPYSSQFFLNDFLNRVVYTASKLERANQT